MNLIWRFFFTLFISRFQPKLNIFDTCETKFTVLPTDIDLLMHMNNGRYLSILDLARINLIIRSNILPILNHHHYYPVVASEMIRFKKSILLFKKFIVSTKILGWDDKYFYIEHHFKIEQEIYASALIKAAILKKGGIKNHPQDIANLIGISQAKPCLPEWINTWQQAEHSFTNTRK